MMRQSENHHWRRLAQLAQDPEALCGACASAPVRQSPLGDGARLAQQKPLRRGRLAPRKARASNWRATGATTSLLVNADKWVSRP